MRSKDLHCWWWLRSPGNNSNNAANVNSNGGVNNNGNNVNNDNDCVRPALLSMVRNQAVSSAVSTEGKGIGFALAEFFCGKIYVGGRSLRQYAVNAIRLAFVLYGEIKRFLPADRFLFYDMNDYEKICNFQNLYKAHTVARLGKRDNKEVILFEMNLGQNLTELSQSLRDKTYEMSGYYNFMVYDPKERKIHALHYRDRVVQHCLCDKVLSPLLDRKLVYDNAACRLGKGTHFAIGRVSEFLHDYYNKYGSDGYFLKCDIRKFFDNIDHGILKEKMSRVIKDKDVMQMLIMIIDSFEKTPGKGLPLGNQTSQWFALYYLDSMDRLIKEKFRIKYYSRYMDDMVIIHQDKEYLKKCLAELRRFAGEELHLEFNEKTQIFPIKNGVDYLGFHIYLSDTGKVIRKVKQQTKYKYKRKLKLMQYAFANNQMELDEIRQVLTSYNAHLSYGHTYKLKKRLLSEFVLKKNWNNQTE